MKLTVTFRRNSKNVKKLIHLKNGVFLIYASKQLKIYPIQFERFDTGITVNLQKKFCGYFTSKFKTDEIEQIRSDTQRIWIGILNRSLTEEIVIKKNKLFGFIILETNSEINIKHEAVQKRKKTTSKISKTKGCFLSRYDFAYAGRDTVNQVGKIAPGLIENASSEINSIVQQIINEIISQGGNEIERVPPNILRGAIEDVYQTPFRLLQKFGKQ